MFPAPFTNPWISTDNPSAYKAAVVTVLINPAPLGIQTFIKCTSVYIVWYSYFKYICSCICSECRRFSREYIRIICSCPKCCVQTQDPFGKVPCPECTKSLLFIHSSLADSVFIWKSPREASLRPFDHMQYTAAFSVSSLLSWIILHQLVIFCQANVIGF